MPQKRFTRHRPLFTSPVPKAEPKVKWRILPIVWLGLKRTSMVIGAFVLFSMFLGVISTMTVSKQVAPAVPKDAVLYLEFKDGIRETPQRASFADPFAQGQPTVRAIVRAIDEAATDDRIKGIAARMYDGHFSLSHIQEIRAALKRFQASGKWTKIYSSSFGGGGTGIGRFYLASAFGERWMQPLGIVAIEGVRAEVPYLKGLLGKIGVTPEFFQKKEYKTAYESLTSEEMSPENKRMLRDIIENVQKVLLVDIPSDLGIDPNKFDRMVNEGIFTSDKALAAGLITHSDYADVLVAQIKEEITGDPESEETVFVGVPSYLGDLKKKAKGPKVALIYAVGAIMSNNGEQYEQEGVAASEIIAPAILDAADDPNVEAIVLRVDSPGGSPVASESILRASQRAKEKGKMVVVSMGATAASGGYWASAYADRIFATNTTLTGSIGVVGGKFAADGLWDKIGVNWDGSVYWGENSDMWSFTQPFDAQAAGKVNEMLDHVYDSFITRVAVGRGMNKEQVDQIARGRVWTGTQAKNIGLVDEIGGLYDTLNYVAVELGAESQDNLDVVVMPKPKTFQEQLVELFANQGQVYEGLKIQARLAQFFKPLMQTMTVMMSSEPALTYEPLVVE